VRKTVKNVRKIVWAVQARQPDLLVWPAPVSFFDLGSLETPAFQKAGLCRFFAK
jgi:hypothetical protein